MYIDDKMILNAPKRLRKVYIYIWPNNQEPSKRLKGFRPIILETLILRYGLKGKAKARPDFIRVVLAAGAQFYPCEALEQKWGQTPKS